MRYRLKITVIALCLGVEYEFTKTITSKNQKLIETRKKGFIDNIKDSGYEIKTVSCIGKWVK